jgi:hypothetical protein
MGIKLVSDFVDFYDFEFSDPNGDSVFRRVTTDGLDRYEMLVYLEKLEFLVPLYGTAKELSDMMEPHEEIILHTDIYAHRGDGKERSTIAEALAKCPETLATRFIPFDVPNTPPEVKGLSWRYLQVGTETFWLQYTSTEDWRSNCGEGDVELFFRDKTQLFNNHQYKDLLIYKYPLFAIDFVPSGEDLYAVDFNIAPQVRGTGVNKILSASDAAKAITTAYERLKKNID